MTQLSATVGSALESSAGTVERQMTQLSATVGSALESSAGTVEKTDDPAERRGGRARSRRPPSGRTRPWPRPPRRRPGRPPTPPRTPCAARPPWPRRRCGPPPPSWARTLQPMLAAEAQRLELIKEAFGQSVTRHPAGHRAPGRAAGRARGDLARPGGGHRGRRSGGDGRLRQGGGGGGDRPRRGRRQAGRGRHRHHLRDRLVRPARSARSPPSWARWGASWRCRRRAAPKGDLGAVVLGELERIGAGLDRLAQLHRLARGRGRARRSARRPSWAPPPRPSRSAPTRRKRRIRDPPGPPHPPCSRSTSGPRSSMR